MTYDWKPRTMIKLPAQDVGEELERIRTRHRGALHPEHVVQAALSPKNILHNAFEWDDTKAAVEHRLSQARHIIRHITVVMQPDPLKKPITIRAFVSVQNGDKHYTSIDTALSDTTYRKQLLEQAFNDLEIWQNKYAELEELSDIFDAITNVRAGALVP